MFLRRFSSSNVIRSDRCFIVKLDSRASDTMRPAIKMHTRFFAFIVVSIFSLVRLLSARSAPRDWGKRDGMRRKSVAYGN